MSLSTNGEKKPPRPPATPTSPGTVPVSRWKSSGTRLKTIPKVDSVNSFEAPNAVVPKAIVAKVEGCKLVWSQGGQGETTGEVTQ